MKKIEIIFLFLILILGIGLRSVEVLNKNFLFGFDQGRDYLAVRQIVVDRKPTLIGPEVGAGSAGVQWIFHGPYYYYSLILPFVLFNGDPYGGIVLMFVFGVLSLFLCFWLGYKMFGKKVALVATFLLSVSPLITSQSRFMWNSHPTTFFILIAFWFTFKTLENPIKYFFLATFWAGLIYGFELAISIPLIIGQFLYVLLILKIKKLKVYLAGVCGVILSHLPFFTFEVRHGFMAIRGIFGGLLSLGERSLMYRFHMFYRHLSAFWVNFQTTFLLNKYLLILLFLILLKLIFFYLKKEKKSEESYFVRFLVILPIVTFIVFLFLDNAVWDHYLIHLHLAYIFIFAFFLNFLTHSKIKIALIVFLLLMAPGVFKEINRAYNDYYDYGGTAKIQGKLETLDYIYRDAQGEKFNVLVFTPPVYDYAYQYLLKWYGKAKYGYVPGNKKEGLFYLWIEPESSGIWHKGWLETVIKSGEVLKEETLPSGFIIQKRYEES